MKNIGIVILLLAATVFGQASDIEQGKEIDQAGKVMKLTDDNWTKKVMHGGEQTHMMILFESFKNRDSRQLGSSMVKFAKQMEGELTVAKADCDLSAKQVCKSFGVGLEDLPCLLLIEKRAVSIYDMTEVLEKQDELAYHLTFLETLLLNSNIEAYVRDQERIQFELNKEDEGNGGLLFQIGLVHDVFYRNMIQRFFWMFGVDKDWSVTLQSEIIYLGIFLPILLVFIYSIFDLVFDFDSWPIRGQPQKRPQPQRIVKNTQGVVIEPMYTENIQHAIEMNMAKAAYNAAQYKSCLAYVAHLGKFNQQAAPIQQQ